MNNEILNNPFFAYTALLAQMAIKRMEQEGYTKDEEGFYICPECKTRASVYNETLGCMVTAECECKKAKKKEEEERERLTALEARRMKSFSSKSLCDYTFKNDKGLNPKIVDVTKQYVRDFAKLKKDGRGMLLYGSVGSGKTFLACAIGNALIDMGYHVKQTNFAILESELSGTYNKQSIINSLVTENDIVIIDDLGIERNTSYMKEIVFNVIDKLYCEKTPFIVTTNLSANELKSTSDIENTRIYDRIIERCTPTKVENDFGSYRGIIFAEHFEQNGR